MMFTKTLLFETLRAVLVEERDAIARLDALAMDRASTAKENILTALHQTPYESRGPLIEALAELQPELRHNMILLTHAAAMVAEARRAAREANKVPQRLAS